VFYVNKLTYKTDEIGKIEAKEEASRPGHQP
jgi:hypothetical protein